MAIRIDVPATSLDHVRETVFGGNVLNAGDEETVENGIAIVNMTAGASNVSPPEAFTFFVENVDNIASGVVAAVIYDCFLKSGGFIVMNGRKMFTRKEVEAEIDDERET